jgi:hypothetical protein
MIDWVRANVILLVPRGHRILVNTTFNLFPASCVTDNPCENYKKSQKLCKRL